MKWWSCSELYPSSLDKTSISSAHGKSSSTSLSACVAKAAGMAAGSDKAAGMAAGCGMAGGAASVC
eukprot:2725172-Heterocapsa_arctica.AAC.1